MIHMTAQEYQSIISKGGKVPPLANSNSATQKQKKYHNKKVYCYDDGFTSQDKTLTGHGKIVQRYDSVKEFNRHAELKLYERSGKISDLETQKPLLVFEAFMDKDGKRHKAIYYVADFFYIENGIQVVEDVKAFDINTGKFLMTETFRIKWKILQSKNPEYVFRIY